MPPVSVISMTSMSPLGLILVLATILYMRYLWCLDYMLLLKKKSYLWSNNSSLTRSSRFSRVTLEHQSIIEGKPFLSKLSDERGDILVFTIGWKNSYKNVDPDTYLINNDISLNTRKLIIISLKHYFPYGENYIRHIQLLAEYFIWISKFYLRQEYLNGILGNA